MTDLDRVTSSTDSPYEPAPNAAQATPVEAPPSTTAGRPLRWPIAVAVVVLVIIVSAVVAVLITGQAPNAKVLGYVPDGTVMYGEARLDLPGDQRLALASFLSKFPGFADQAAIEGKLDEVMDRFVGGVTRGDQSFSTDIKPWFDGELAFSVGPLPDPGTLSGGVAALPKGARYLVLASVKDAAGVTAWFKDVASSSDAALSDEAYDGATLTVLSSEGGRQCAFAVLDGKVAVYGDVESVKAAVDTGGSGQFAAQADPRSALDATDADHVGFIYLALGQFVDWSTRLPQMTGSTGSPGFDLGSGALRGLVPTWSAFALRVEGDGLVLESAAARPATAFGPTDARSSVVTDHVPAGALVVGLNHDEGATLTQVLDAYRAEPALKSIVDGVDQAVSLLGGVNGAVGWIGDTAVVVDGAGAGIEGGLVVLPTDRAAADRLFTGLHAFIALGGSQAGITLSDEAYAGTTITTVDLGDLGAFAGRVGIPPEMLGAGSALATSRVQLSYGITDQIVVIGSGPAFVKHVLDTTAASSIGSTDRYNALVARVGSGTSSVFVDVAAIRGMIESALATSDPSAVPSYEQNIKPYLAPFDAVIASSAVKGDISTSKVVITVK